MNYVSWTLPPGTRRRRQRNRRAARVRLGGHRRGHVRVAVRCFVDPGTRGRGIGRLLIAGVVNDLAPLRLKRTVLATADAHELYEQYGFVKIDQPRMWMSRSGPLSFS
ncbi:GNAT family N-acetyltransferase [Rhodococcus gannanensis]|uniref:GNAT family N-acetyltransferase n=1 Tax=Rhodococcus gannanensis TaxID=1960308 RepID=A0ABW4NWU3_9NOCA